MEAAPVPLAQDPGQHVDFEVELGRELGADEVGRARAFPPCDQLPTVAVATVLGCERGGVTGKRGADAVACRRLVDVQTLLGTAGVPPAEVAGAALVVEADHGVGHLRGVGAGAAGQLRHDQVEVALQELALTVEPLLTAVHICGTEKQTSRFSLSIVFTQKVELPDKTEDS